MEETEPTDQPTEEVVKSVRKKRIVKKKKLSDLTEKTRQLFLEANQEISSSNNTQVATQASPHA
jgi:hypothetical protein